MSVFIPRGRAAKFELGDVKQTACDDSLDMFQIGVK